MKHFKALITITLIIAMVLSAVACNTNTPPQTEQPIAVVEATQEATEKATAEPTEEPTPTPSPEPTPEPTPTVMKDRGTDFDKSYYFSYLMYSESEYNEFIEKGGEIPEWYVEEDDTFENRYGFDINYDGTDDYRQDWNSDGVPNYQEQGFYWYCDDDNDGTMNVFDRDWAGFEWLPFGEGVLPEKQEDVQHLAPAAESKYEKYEKLIAEAYSAEWQKRHIKVEPYEGSTIRCDPQFIANRTASGHFIIQTVTQERCYRVTNGKPMDFSFVRFQYAPELRTNAFLGELMVRSYGCKVENIDEIEDLYGWFCENNVPIAHYDPDPESGDQLMTEFKETAISYWEPDSKVSNEMDIRIYVTIFDREGETYIALAFMHFAIPKSNYVFTHHFDENRQHYGVRCAGCGMEGYMYLQDEYPLWYGHPVTGATESYSINIDNWKIYHTGCLPNF